MNEVLCFLLKCAQDIHVFFYKLLEIQLWNIIVAFLLSVKTAELSFNIFLVSEPTIDNLTPLLKKLEEINKDSYFKPFLKKYCIITGLLVVSVCSMQLEQLRLSTVVVYSLFGPYLIRDKLRKSISEDVSNATLDAVKGYINHINQQKRTEEEEYKKILENIKKEAP